MWGLGATLYAAVEGRAPFSGGDAMETLSKVVQEPPAPYERAGPLVPALDAMLEKDPVKRARPVDARRALLDVLRGGDRGRGAGAVRAAVRGGRRRPSRRRCRRLRSRRRRSAAGPGLADLLVPVWRQGRSEEALAAAPAGTGQSAGRAAGRAGRGGHRSRRRADRQPARRRRPGDRRGRRPAAKRPAAG